MSLFSRLFGKPQPSPAAPDADRPATPPAAAPPKPDPDAAAREEEAALARAVAAGDTAAIGRCVTEGRSARIRQLAAQAVTDLEQIRELIRATRGKDKSVHRILADKRDARLAAERSAQQRLAETEEAAAAIAQHAERPFDAGYQASLARLEARWQSVAAGAALDVQQRVALHLARARQVVEEHHSAAAAEAEKRRLAAAAAERARRDREADAHAAAAAAAEQARAAADARQAELAQRAADDAEVRRLIGLLRQTEAAIGHGGTARATRLRDALREQLAAAPPLPAWFERKLHDVEARIDELKDWNTFTVVPKRAQLVQRMQALIGADMSPEELARQIRRLRAEWQTLHRGAAEASTPERAQFDEAAERAYEPCRAHFARQAEQRQQNQARREALLERLAEFAAGQSGDAVDWRHVQQVLAEARREWRSYAPVDQGVVESLQERFQAVTGGLQSGLEAEYGRNAEAKQRLVARAAELAGVEDSRQATEGVKELQRTWKTIGLVPRHHDQALWAEFRRHCDAVFERATQQSAAHGASLENNRARATALCEQLESIADREGDALREGLQQLAALSGEFDALELPRAYARDLRRRFSRAAERCDAAARRGPAAVARQAWNRVLAASAQVRDYAFAAVRPGAGDPQALREAALQSVAGITPTHKEARAILEQQLAAVAAGTFDSDLAANEAALRLLCVRAELVAGVPTPEQDLELRREYQMQRLVESMGSGARAQPADLDDLALAWLSVGPVAADTGRALQERFERCREAAGI